MRTLRTVTASAALSLLCACAGAPPKPLPGYFTAAAPSHVRYPQARYIVANAFSGVSAEDADARAKSAVASQVQAQLKSEFDSWMRESTSGSAQRVSERIQISTDFRHAHLIKVVEREAREVQWYAFAALDRAETASALERDAAQDRVTFGAAVERALAARREGRSGEFGMAVREANKVRPGLEATYITLRAVLGRPAQAEPDYVKHRDELLKAVQDARSKRFVDVRVRGEETRLLKMAVSAVQKLGLRVANGKGCEEHTGDKAADATELVLEPDEACSEGSLGERCEVSVRLAARACSGQSAGEGLVPQVRGVHPSDRNRAKNAAWNRITEQAIETAVRDALRGTIATGGE